MITKEQLESIISSIPFDDIQEIRFSCDSEYYVVTGVDSKGILYVLEEGQMEELKVGSKVTIVDTSELNDRYNIGDTAIIVDTCGNHKYLIRMYDGETQIADDWNIRLQEDEPMEQEPCLLCELEAAYDTIDELKDELLESKDHIIELQAEIIRLAREPVVCECDVPGVF